MRDTEITIIYTYFGQKERLSGIVNEKHPNTRVVIVDDCSPEPLNVETNGFLDGIDGYRIEDDIPWNQPAARNLGFQESEGWIVCADIDHLVTKENVEELLKLKKEKGTIYYLGREDDNSWNVYLIHKDDFEKIGGYDEDFCGHYGYDDILFLWQCQKNLIVNELREIKVKVYAKESSSKLERDFEFNKKLLELKRHNDKNTNKRINFKWKKL
jgi:predicted glycosyltransferase involved in capsule biosynthesis